MAAPMIRVTLLILFLNCKATARTIKTEEIPHYRQKVVEMFHHAYDGYIKYAYPYDELRPLTCDGHDTWGSYSLTLIDSLDLLVIMGNNSEFQRVAKLVLDHTDFDLDINVSVFETNIRVVGGLISAHLMAKRGGMDLEPGWPCSGPFLRMAENVARRLLPAFNTATGMPYGTVNLRHGVPKGETTVTCTAGVGTFIVEFGALSKLTGDPIFEKVAMRAMDSLWKARSEISLVGNHIDVATGKWTALDAGVGGGIDSYFEYLVKGSIMLNNPQLLEMFKGYLVAVEKYLKKDDWYMFAHMTKGTISLPIFTSLDCYWPGIQSMLGDIDKAMKTIHNFHQVWKQFGFLPEFYNIVKNEAHSGREGYPLRPELVEAAMYLYRATKDLYLLEIGEDMIHSIEHSTRTKCGYATVKDVNTHMLENRMESFFLAETIKYLYLLFDPDNFIHNTGDHGTKIQTPNGECIIDTGSYIFNTEGHPFDTAALYCCSAEKKEDDAKLQDFHDNLDLLSLLDLDDNTDTARGVKWNSKKKRKDEFGLDDIFIDDLKLDRNRLNVQLKGDHQNVLSTEGKVFKKKGGNVPVISLNVQGSDIKISDNKEREGIVTAKENIKFNVDTPKIKPSVLSKEIKQHFVDEDSEGCSIDKEGPNCKKDSEDKYSKKIGDDESVTANDNNLNRDVAIEKDRGMEEDHVLEDAEEKYGSVLTPDMKSSESSEEEKGEEEEEESDERESIEEETEDEEDDGIEVKEKQQSNTKKPMTVLGEQFTVDLPDKSLTQSSINPEVFKLDKISDVMNILKSLTSDVLSKGGTSSSLKTLHNKLQYYNLFKHSSPELMTCKAQPFHMRFSALGEMFLDS